MSEIQKNAPDVVKQQELDTKSKVQSYVEKANKPVNEAIKSSLQSIPELNIFAKVKYTKLKTILEGKEKSSEKTSERKEILKSLDLKIEESLQKTVKKTSFDDFAKSHKKEGETIDETKNRLREQFLSAGVKDFNKTNIDKDGNIIPSKREKLLKEEPFLKNLNGKLLDEAAVIYGKETMKKLSPFLEKLEGKKLPANLEELNVFIEYQIVKKEIEELKKEDSNYQPNKEDVLNRIQKARKENPNYLKSALTNYNSVGKKYNFEKGPNLEYNALLDNTIDSLPEGQAKEMLLDAKEYIGLNENNPDDNKKLKSLLGFDPAKTPWCKGFVNAIAKKNGINLNSAGNLAARSGELDGRKLNLPDEKPMSGDLVIVERKGLTSAGTPGGHIGIFIGMSPNGNPIIIGGNQGKGEVSIKEEKRPIISINRVVSKEEEQKNKDYIEKNKS